MSDKNPPLSVPKEYSRDYVLQGILQGIRHYKGDSVRISVLTHDGDVLCFATGATATDLARQYDAGREIEIQGTLRQQRNRYTGATPEVDIHSYRFSGTEPNPKEITI